VAADDAQGRCENCIRLRKECQFFPVDQQPPVEKKSRPSSRLEAGSDPSVTTPMSLSSSPTSLNPESVEAFYPYAQVPMNASSGDMAAFNPGAFAATQMPGFTPGMLACQICLSWAKKAHVRFTSQTNLAYFYQIDPWDRVNSPDSPRWKAELHGMSSQRYQTHKCWPRWPPTKAR
jgi:hypothetical protein